MKPAKLPKMPKMPKSGFFWHIHHSGLLAEYSSNIQERIRFIQTQKLAFERPVRLRRLRPANTINKLFPAEVRELNLLAQARRKLVRDKKEARPAQRNIISILISAVDARVRGLAQEVNQHADLVNWHRKECKNCPWEKNGGSLFKR